MSSHAFLSPSASHRWLNCPPSAKLCATLPDQTSPYAAQGTDAHELCAYLVEKALGRDVKDPTESLSFYDAEMQTCAEGYAEFVMQEYELAKQTCPDTDVLIEQKVDFSKWVEGGTGTADCILLSDGTAEIIDYKHGLGVMVSAESEEFGGNPQLMCYALGLIDMFDGIYNIDTIRMAIYQPRRDNVSICQISKDDLMKWAEETLAPTAILATKGEGEFKAGDHCQFCKVKATCRKRAEYNLEMAKYDFEVPATLEDHEIEAILMKVDQLTSWAEDVKEYALNQALQGKEYEHFKVVEGRSNRKYTDENAVAFAVKDAGFDPYEKKLLGITAMTSLLGKKKFDELLGGLTMKPPGKPTLVSKSDKRPAMKNTAQEDFNVKE
ncbi:DUF2800 domain-containing protein [Clostridium perfringens]|uniref:DUF2800 domain-containing protein n=1 Tax=Clostridium perfringens TaxID=1502 RepID=UPI0018E4A25C|nr:DUF2800 domain-containing protein [Clostridium perfringens]MBI5994026.1 DUF2800 domain-containing protein [Clostridium perfringens]MBI5999906.1 DUF2800 domain-containing protein [Clostridium perfringens]MDK0567945.1 DUF2800 domain-containing protein [Clostridium perfringens]